MKALYQWNTFRMRKWDWDPSECWDLLSTQTFAVRWKMVIDRYLHRNNFNISTRTFNHSFESNLDNESIKKSGSTFSSDEIFWLSQLANKLRSTPAHRANNLTSFAEVLTNPTASNDKRLSSLETTSLFWPRSEPRESQESVRTKYALQMAKSSDLELSRWNFKIQCYIMNVKNVFRTYQYYQSV